MIVTRREYLMGVTALIASSPSVSVPRHGNGVSGESAYHHLDAICNRHIAEGRAAGISVHMEHRGNSFAKGYGYENLETRSPTTPATVFRVGSITKQFTAAGLLLLQDEGRLSLSDPLARYLPQFPGAKWVTIHELLNHTSGISNLTAGVIPCIDYPLDDLVEIISRQKPLYAFAPGTRWSYSNTAFALAGAVIERIAGMHYWEFWAQRFFRPLGLDSMAIDLHADVVSNRASGYAFSSDSTSFSNAPYLSCTIPGPAGALRATAGDLARWHLALFGGRVLSSASLKEMTRPTHLKNGRLASTDRVGPLLSPYQTQENGLGLELTRSRGRARVGHYGTIPGFAADMGTFPELGLTIVVLTNSDLGANNPPRGIDASVLQALPS